MDPWLSAYMIVAAFLVAFADAIYSASTDNVAMVGCFLDDHDMTPPPTSKANLLVDR